MGGSFFGSLTLLLSQIIAEAGPIIIGENNLIEEQVRIHNIAPQSAGPSSNCTVMIVGSNNVFEVDCFTEALNIGMNDQSDLYSFTYISRSLAVLVLMIRFCGENSFCMTKSGLSRLDWQGDEYHFHHSNDLFR